MTMTNQQLAASKDHDKGNMAPLDVGGRYFTKALLKEAYDNYETWGFNRGMAERFLDLPEGEYEIEAAYIHKWAFMEQVADHARCIVPLPVDGDLVDVAIDVPMDFFKALPIREVQAEEKEAADGGPWWVGQDGVSYDAGYRQALMDVIGNKLGDITDHTGRVGTLSRRLEDLSEADLLAFACRLDPSAVDEDGVIDVDLFLHLQKEEAAAAPDDDE